MGRKKLTDNRVSLIQRARRGGGVMYYARWFENGKETWRSLRTSDPREAAEKLHILEGLVRRQKAAPRPVAVRARITWEAAWARYRGAVEVEPVTESAYRYIWVRAEREMELTYLDECTRPALESWRDWMMAQPKISRRVVNQRLAVLSIMLRRLVRLGELAANPMTDVERVRGTQLVKRLPVLTVAEVDRIIEEARSLDPEMEYYIALGAMAGLRVKERMYARGSWIQWHEDGETGVLCVPAEDLLDEAAPNPYMQRFRAKRDKARLIPLSRRLGQILRRRPDPDAFFVHPEITVWEGYKRFEYLKRLHFLMGAVGVGERGIVPKNLRHTFASNAVAAGVSPYKVKEWMGHVDFRIMSIYTHLAPYDSDIERIHGD